MKESGNVKRELFEVEIYRLLMKARSSGSDCGEVKINANAGDAVMKGQVTTLRLIRNYAL